ncbi:hypothetical protein CR513_42845, partial [Mucuna pruriens]
MERLKVRVPKESLHILVRLSLVVTIHIMRVTFLWLVGKIGICILPHPKLYNEKREIVVDKQVPMTFTLGKYVDEVKGEPDMNMEREFMDSIKRLKEHGTKSGRVDPQTRIAG